MKICIPVSKNEGLLSIPYGHFGSAPLFIVVDSDTKEVTPIKNGDIHHEPVSYTHLRAHETR